jgi:hypothetical protein
MNISRLMLTVIASLMALTFSGFAHAADTSMYYWLDYERDLLQSYVQPEDLKEFEATLLNIIKTSDESDRKPPPGVLAEYGYLLYERGEFDPAIEYFEREAREWPESVVLMNRIIKRAKEGAGS